MTVVSPVARLSAAARRTRPRPGIATPDGARARWGDAFGLGRALQGAP